MSCARLLPHVSLKTSSALPLPLEFLAPLHITARPGGWLLSPAPPKKPFGDFPVNTNKRHMVSTMVSFRWCEKPISQPWNGVPEFESPKAGKGLFTRSTPNKLIGLLSKSSPETQSKGSKMLGHAQNRKLSTCRCPASLGKLPAYCLRRQLNSAG